jgi:CheY-like chemotaxis protein/HPt (histidine-containing phosphotransfer) domain-containing protein
MEQSHTAPPGQIHNVLPQLSVLVADDNPVNRKLTVRYLQRLGYTVDEAADGREAVEAVKSARYAAVLMDCEMPEMDGYQATSEIRRMEGDGRHTRIVAITAHDADSDRAKCLTAGMDEFMTKPVRPESLAQMLEGQAAAKQQATATAAEGGSPGDASPVLDPEMLGELREEGQDFLDELIETFDHKTPARIAELADRFARGDLKAAALSAHSLKGTAGNLGAKRMWRICAALDTMARNGAVEQAASLIGDLRAEYRLVQDALHAEHSAPTAAAEA